jgi:hypothetical protein
MVAREKSGFYQFLVYLLNSLFFDLFTNHLYV